MYERSAREAGGSPAALRRAGATTEGSRAGRIALVIWEGYCWRRRVWSSGSRDLRDHQKGKGGEGREREVKERVDV